MGLGWKHKSKFVYVKSVLNIEKVTKNANLLEYDIMTRKVAAEVNRPANRVRNLTWFFTQKPDNEVTLNYLKVIHFRHVSTMMIYHHHDRSFKYYSCTKATERLWKVWS